MIKTLDNDLLKAVANHIVNDELWSHAKNKDAEINDFITEIAEQISKSGLLDTICTFEFKSASDTSFVKIFCPKSDGSSIHTLTDGKVISGIVIYICRYAPIAVWGCGTRNESSTSNYDIECNLSLIYTPPKIGDWTNEIKVVEDILTTNNLYLPSRKELSSTLDFKLPFKSELSVENEGMFDALFHIVNLSP